MKSAEKELEKVKIEDEVTDVICEECGTKYGDQIRPPRKISGMPGISGVPEYQAVSGKDRRDMPEMRQRRCDPQDEKGQKILWL